MFTLFYPSGFLTIRNPELGDVRRLDTNVSNRATIGGEFKTVDEWPNKQYRAFSIRALTKAQTTAFRTALEDSAGLEVQISDYNDEIWEGYIVSNPNDLVTIRDDCHYDIAFEMMCEYSGLAPALENGDDDPVLNGDEDAVKVI